MNSSHEKCFRKIRTKKSKHTFYVPQNFSENRSVSGIMWETAVEPDRTQMAL